MAVLDFPNSPTVGATYTAPNGAIYTWDGSAWTVSGVLSTGSVAGGDLTGTYPNPSVTPAAKSKWTTGTTTITPTDTTKTVAAAPVATAVQWGGATSATVRHRLRDSNGELWLLSNSDGTTVDDATKPQWLLVLSAVADGAYLHRAVPGSTSAWVQQCLIGNGGSGNIIISGPTGQKSAGTTWANPSDPRLKNDIAPYARSLADILPLEPITYTLKADPTATTCYGFDAAQVQAVFPECVTETTMKLSPDDAEETAGVLSFDMHPILVALVNAVKELATRVAALEAPAPAQTHA